VIGRRWFFGFEGEKLVKSSPKDSNFQSKHTAIYEKRSLKSQICTQLTI